MEVVEGKIPSERPTKCVVLFGDGQRDRRVFKSLARRVNGRREILAPQIGGRTGLKTSIDAAAWIVQSARRKPEVILIVIDREHLEREDLEQVLKEYFGSWEYVVKESDRIKIVVRKGAWQGTLLFAVQGIEKSIEENICVLIEEMFGESIEPTKGAIRKFLRDRKFRDERELIESSDMGRLRRAFGSLIWALEELENW